MKETKSADAQKIAQYIPERTIEQIKKHLSKIFEAIQGKVLQTRLSSNLKIEATNCLMDLAGCVRGLLPEDESLDAYINHIIRDSKIFISLYNFALEKGRKCEAFTLYFMTKRYAGISFVECARALLLWGNPVNTHDSEYHQAGMEEYNRYENRESSSSSSWITE